MHGALPGDINRHAHEAEDQEGRRDVPVDTGPRLWMPETRRDRLQGRGANVRTRPG